MGEICSIYSITNNIQTIMIWATTWQNQQNECVLSEDSDQPGHPPSLIRVLAVRSWELRTQGFFMRTAKTPIRLGGCPGWSLWSDWVADAQAVLSLCWAHTHFVGLSCCSSYIQTIISFSVKNSEFQSYRFCKLSPCCNNIELSIYHVW